MPQQHIKLVLTCSNMLAGSSVLDIYCNVGGCAAAAVMHGCVYHALETNTSFFNTAPLAVTQFLLRKDSGAIEKWFEGKCDGRY